jgi:hypothetical protein
MRRQTKRRQKGGGCVDPVAYARCKAGAGWWFKRFTSLIRPVLLKYIIDNPNGSMCMTNSGTLLRQFVRDEKSKQSTWSGLVWKATEDRQANLQIRWIMDTIRTDNEFRVACRNGNRDQMVLIMDEYLQRFKDHSCDAFNSDYYYESSAGCTRTFSKYDTSSNSMCDDLGYRVSCTDPRVVDQNARSIIEPIAQGLSAGRRRRRSTLRPSLV